MTDLNPETDVTVKFGDLQELQELWWGFGGLGNVLKLMGEEDGSLGVYYTVKPLFDRLTALCFDDGGLDANMIEFRLKKKKDDGPQPVSE